MQREREEEVPTDQPAVVQAQPTTDSFPAVGEPHWQADDYLKASKALFAAARYGEVRAVLEQGLRQTPDSLPLRFHLGLLLVTGLGHYEEGAQVLEDAVRDYPTSVDSHFYLGRAYLGLNRLAEAIQSFERAVALVPSSWEYHTWLGLANVRADSLQAAAAAFEQAAEQAPWEPNPHLQLVSCVQQAGAYSRRAKRAATFRALLSTAQEGKKSPTAARSNAARRLGTQRAGHGVRPAGAARRGAGVFPAGCRTRSAARLGAFGHGHGALSHGAAGSSYIVV